MKHAWPIVKLGDVLSRIKDGVIVQDDKQYTRLTIRMNGKGISRRDTILGNSIGTKNQFVARAGQFVLSKIDARNGAFGLLPNDCDNAIITGNFWAFNIDKERLLPKYFEYLTKTPVFIDFCIRGSEGTTNRLYLRESKFLAQDIPLPPLAEQQRIVARIEELASQIEEARTLRQQVNEEVEQLCRALIASDPTSKLTPLRELVRMISPNVIVQRNEMYPFAGVYCFGRGVFKAQIKSGMDFEYPRLTRIKTGNFVYPKLMAWEGAFGVVPPECDGCVVSTEFPVFEVLEEKVLPEVLDTYFRNPAIWPEIAGASTGTNVRRRRLNPSDFLDYKMPLPSMAVQHTLRKVRQQTTSLKQLHAETVADLDALLPALLDRAFKGEL